MKTCPRCRYRSIVNVECQRPDCGHILNKLEKENSEVSIMEVAKRAEKLKEAIDVIKQVRLFAKVNHTDPKAYQDVIKDFVEKYKDDFK